MTANTFDEGAVSQPKSWAEHPTGNLQRVKIADRIWTVVMWVAAIFLVIVLFGVVSLILVAGVPYITLQFLLTPGTFDNPGIGPIIWVTFYTLFLTLALVVPIGIGAAVYLHEYASENRFTNAIRFSTESLASVPSIVFGVFGSIVFLTMMQLGFSVLSGSLTLAILNLPLMVRVAEDAVRGVPDSFREGSLALAGSKWETIRKVVLPTASAGILTAVVLTAGRIIGETAPLILTMGTTISPNAYYSLNPLATGETLAVHIWVIKIVGMPGVPNSEQVANATSATLLIMVLLINMLAAFFTSRLQRRLTGGKKR
ncbi:MAG: phosphate ABC transporter permease PstA [Caldilineaceae bacterium]